MLLWLCSVILKKSRYSKAQHFANLHLNPVLVAWPAGAQLVQSLQFCLRHLVAFFCFNCNNDVDSPTDIPWRKAGFPAADCIFAGVGSKTWLVFTLSLTCCLCSHLEPVKFLPPRFRCCSNDAFLCAFLFYFFYFLMSTVFSFFVHLCSGLLFKGEAAPVEQSTTQF